MESSSFGRLIGALVAPGKTFRSIAERPTWLVALLVVLLAPVVPSLLSIPKMDFEAITKAQLERMDVQMSREQVDQQVAIAEKIGKVAAYVFPCVLAIIVLLMALVFWGSFTLAGGEPGFTRSLAVVSHGLLPFALGQLLSIPVIISLGHIGPDEIESGSYLKSTLAAFAPEGVGPVMLSFLTRFDLFTVWGLVLMAIGFQHSARVRGRTAGLVVFLLWLVLWVGIGVGFTALGAAMAGRR